MSESARSLIVITGPTASGKTGRAVDVASALGGEIVSADSRQLYRGMDLGTGKDLDEYGSVPYHLIDIADAGEKLNLYTYLKCANAAISDIESRDRLPIVCGGTGMYVEAVVNGLALPEVPENKALRDSLVGKSLAELTEILSGMKRLHNVTDVDTAKRAIRAIEIASYYQEHPLEAQKCVPNPRKNAVIFGVDIDRESRRHRISDRLRARLEFGMVDEVRQLLANGVPPEDLIYYGREYKFLTLHVIGELTYEEMFTQLETAIHQFAKRQMTWFRGMERRGLHVEWLPWDLPKDDFIDAVRKRSGL
ncbi:MAG: tRNA (adenosine(37)-N6)-dimethylallyltransferase MiaA [Muribaculaceae bacterium]|nr:tRNA (adenosine(37)-N6)-dimethylallyltransferase MiaA [Muribaculaceae bacterium]